MKTITKLGNTAKQNVRFAVYNTNHSKKGGKGMASHTQFIVQFRQYYSDGSTKLVAKSEDGKYFFMDGKIFKPGMVLTPVQFADENNPLGLKKGFYPTPGRNSTIFCEEIEIIK